jgi:membrane-bound ClpP family serine protease
MKNNYLIPIVLILGLITLFFFPSPADNILTYLGTALFFIALIVFLIIKNKK